MVVKHLVENVIGREIRLVYRKTLGIHPSTLTKEILRLLTCRDYFIEVVILICFVYMDTPIVEDPGPCGGSNGWLFVYVYLCHEVLLS
jgi:hypothetical protein